ncbi:uncharacterized protein LOC133348628 [Lethenteron reissneri]|uniref:uncharacterized protein LOC133348628 n=1 Tax=Lethenteron reissneri TaxID=7753 RepID=UPI002AB64529|nr:uncharacterized protein LOC133348628 [Lethenteron reissneri]
MKLVLVLAALVQLGECGKTQTNPTIGNNGASTNCEDSSLSLNIDGNPEMNYNLKKCTSSKGGLDQSWWKLDMHQEVQVYAVNIMFQSDNIYKHTFSTKVHIGINSDFVTGYAKCKTLKKTAQSTVVTFNCKGVKGCYISINSTSYAPLSLSEVKVSTTPLLQNEMSVAYGEAMQSSTVGPDHKASKAIDATNGTNFCSGMCSATSYEWEPWFCIELDDVYTVDAVRITNRDDAEGIRLFGAHIKVGESSNHNDNALCAKDIL